MAKIKRPNTSKEFNNCHVPDLKQTLFSLFRKWIMNNIKGYAIRYVIDFL